MEEVFQSPVIEPVRFHHVAHLYTRPSEQTVEQTKPDVIQPKIEFEIWEAFPGEHMPPYLVVDRMHKINEATQDCCLAALDRKAIQEILSKVPDSVTREVNKTAKLWNVAKDVDETIPSILVQPIKRLRSAEYLRAKDWIPFVKSLTSFNLTNDVDERLALIRKAHLLRSVNMQLGPHALVCTNPGTGKTTWYQQEGIGSAIDKATPNSFLGFAKSPKEIFAGTVDHTDRAVAIDQLESQGAPELVRYLFQLMENGRALVSSGSVKFPVSSSATFAFLANPVGYNLNPAKSFNGLIAHLSSNPAIGRRFGIILYAVDIKVIEDAPMPEVLDKWRAAIDEFRAVEEFAFEEIQKIIFSKEVWPWLNNRNSDYAQGCVELLEGLLDDNVVSFLKEVVSPSGQRRTRAGALYCAIVDHLKEIALHAYEVAEIIDSAESYLSELMELNIRSIMNIASQWGKEDSARKSTLFVSLPGLEQEIVSAIELRKRAHPTELKFTLGEIRYTPKNEVYRGSFHEVVREFSRRKNASQRLGKIRTLFGFNLFKEQNEWVVALEKVEPIAEIHPLGTYETLDDFGKFGKSGNSVSPAGNSIFSMGQKRPAEPVSPTLTESPNAPNLPKKGEKSEFWRPDLELSRIEKKDGTVLLRCRKHPDERHDAFSWQNHLATFHHGD